MQLRQPRAPPPNRHQARHPKRELRLHANQQRGLGVGFGSALLPVLQCAGVDVLMRFEDYQQLTRQRRNIADALAMPGIADIEFEPPRVTGY